MNKLKGSSLRHLTFISLYGLAVILMFWHIGSTKAVISFSQHLSCIILGYYLGDLLSGITHLTLDNWPSAHLEPFLERVKDVGEIPQDIIRRSNFMEVYGLDFKLHHSNMADITRAGFEELFLRLLPGTAVYVMITSFLIVFFDRGFQWSYVVLVSSFSLLMTQYIHKWAHTSKAPLVVKVLQKLRIITPVKSHAKHHLDTRFNYCLINGWSNPLINGIMRVFYSLKNKP